MSRRKSTEPEVRFTVRLRGAPAEHLLRVREACGVGGQMAEISDAVRYALKRAALAQEPSE
jgi:hypothetical protein